METAIATTNFIESELKKFETDYQITETGLRELVEPFRVLAEGVIDITSKEDIKAVEAARKTLKAKRVEIEKVAKSMRESATKFNKAVLAREKELVAIIEPTEETLKVIEDKIELERERLREEAERKEAEKLQARLDKLNAVNYSIDIHDLQKMPDDYFEIVLKEATAAFEESEKLAAIEKQKEQERIRKEEQQRKEEEERQIKAREAENAFQKKCNERIGQVSALGLVWKDSDQHFILECADFIACVPMLDIKTHDDKKFELVINEIRLGVNNWNEKLKREREEQEKARKKLEEEQAAFRAEQERKESELKAEQERIRKEQEEREAIIKSEQEAKEKELQAREAELKRQEEERIREAQLEQARKEAAEKARIEAEEKSKREAQEKIDREQKEKEEQEQKLLFGEDSDRFAALAQQIDISFLKSAVWTYMKSKKGKTVAFSVRQLLLEAFNLCEANKKTSPRSNGDLSPSTEGEQGGGN